MRRISWLFALVGVLSTGTHLASCGTSDGAARLEDFCRHAVQACTIVGLQQCKTIVAEAGKSPEQKDIDCARGSLDCDDTDLCLASIGGPTSRPGP